MRARTGFTGDTFWKVGSALFSLSILSQGDIPEMTDIPGVVIGAAAQKCRGDFFSGALLDVLDTSRVARAFTNCQSLQSTTSIYYFAIPRKQGGLYLIETITTGIDITPTSEQTARELDSKIRASFKVALARSTQANP